MPQTLGILSSHYTSFPVLMLSADKNFVNEGDWVTFTLKTKGVRNNYSFSYLVSGLQVDSDDFESGDFPIGQFTILNDQASHSFKLKNDIKVEGSEIVTLTLTSPNWAYGKSYSVSINDTST